MDLTQYEIFAVVAALVATWVKHKVDYSNLKAEVMVLKSDNADFKKDLKTLIEAVQEIKLLLAKNQVQ